MNTVVAFVARPLRPFHVGGMGATTGAGGAKLPPIAQTGSQGALRGVAPPTQSNALDMLFYCILLGLRYTIK